MMPTRALRAATLLLTCLPLAGCAFVFADLNPMHPILEGYRDVLLHGGFPNPWHFALGAVWAAAFLLLGFLVFARWEPLFAERA